ncbi:hypothetical protein AY555_04485 [Haematospirillum jordaniae]|uniref:Uncharacterized protein n=2 Tax=Haematospirillum jordaniae TaxID=1549855 RepID=A0A143DDE8_9PROT|nr:hypothetical protein AY555_04485 [Haematospirillum jordaniae]
MPRQTIRIFLALALLLAGYVWWAGKERRSADNARAARPVPVVTAIADTRSVPYLFSAPGTVLPVARVGLRARVESVVEAIHFSEGQEVRQGELLFTLDDRSLKAELAEAEANLARDRAQLGKAQGDARRYADLVRHQATSRQAYEAAIAGVDALQATVNAGMAAIESARVALGHTQIVAPMGGYTGAISVRPGSSVRPSDTDPLVTLTAIRPIEVSFNLPESLLGIVRYGQGRAPLDVIATTPQVSSSPVAGKLVFIDNTVDRQSGTIMLKARFPNEETQLWPGQLVSITLTLRVDHDALTIPDTAVLTSQGGQYVFVVSADKTVAARPVNVARSLDGLAVIDKGLSTGERVVIQGASRLVEGSAVFEQDPEKPENGKAAP